MAHDAFLKKLEKQQQKGKANTNSKQVGSRFLDLVGCFWQCEANFSSSLSGHYNDDDDDDDDNE